MVWKRKRTRRQELRQLLQLNLRSRRRVAIGKRRAAAEDAGDAGNAAQAASELVAFRSLCVLRCFRPDKVVGAVQAVDEVNFEVRKGETLGLVGESGCGKSTTAKLALGLIPPSAGEIRFDGAPASARQDAAWRARRRRMQMVYQDPLGALNPRMKVLDIVGEPLRVMRGDLGTPRHIRFINERLYVTVFGDDKAAMMMKSSCY